MALLGHSGSQAPQLMHSSVMMMAISQVYFRAPPAAATTNAGANIARVPLPFDQRLSACLQVGRLFDLFGNAKPWPGFSCGLGEEEYAAFNTAIARAGVVNGWFTDVNVRHMMKSLSLMLADEALRPWIRDDRMEQRQPAVPKRIGIIMAGNVPMVGFHDLLCVIMSGHHTRIKPSSQDNVLIPAVIDLLELLAPGIKRQVTIADGKLGEVDALIATGSNNTARYFEHYFGHVPRIVRKGRVSVAILDGSETEEDLRFLAEDVFRYFGLGCRNVSKVYLPREFELDRLFKAMYDWNDIVNHHKYANNYDYNRAVWLMEQVKFLDNGFVLLKEDKSLASPMAALYYERFDDREEALRAIESQRASIQVVLGIGKGLCPFGNAQYPNLWDYADDVDTMGFLLGLDQGTNS